jgi:ketosteroid isomerase-like protein
MSTRLGLVAAIALATVVEAQGASADSARLVALEHRVEAATLHRDVAFLDSVYAPTFRFKHATGNLEDRASRLANLGRVLRPGQSRMLSRTLDSLDVEVHGDVALTTGRIHVTREHANPADRAYTVRYARIYVRREGRWWLLTHHSTGETR